MPEATLYLFCGKIAAGKSTLAQQLSEAAGHIYMGEDTWLAALYPGEIRSLPDYVRSVARLRGILRPHVESLLLNGVSVVLDFQANTIVSRQWMKEILAATAVRHELHWLDVPDAECKARMRARNTEGGHEFAPNEADFDLITSYFQAPTEEEGFNIIHHRGGLGEDGYIR